MDDKIIERCKTCEKQCMREGFNKSQSYQVVIERKPKNLDGLRSCREFIRQTESLENFLDGSTYLSRSCLSNPEILIEEVCVEKLSRMQKRGFLKGKNTQEMNATSNILKQRSNQHVKLSKHLLTYKHSIHRSKHTHTHTTCLTNYMFQRQVKIVQ